MIKSFKYIKLALSTAVVSSMVLSPVQAFSQNGPIITEPSYDLVTRTANPRHNLHPHTNQPVITEPSFIVIDYIPATDVPPELIIIDYIPIIDNPDDIMQNPNDNVQTPAPPSSVNTGVKLMPWDEVSKILPIGEPIKVFDVLTGLTYNVKSLSNGSHADVEPATAEDTAIMLKTYNDEWSWNPRPVWVTIGNYTIAASINGMPHANHARIHDNNMDGHVCLHFYGSTTHNGNLAFAQLHQDVLLEAWVMSK